MNDNISFTELFDLDEIQTIQDAFASACNIASIITEPDGTPITKPSNFCRLCMEIIRKNPRGLSNCIKSDSLIGKAAATRNFKGAIVQPCMSGGLWDGGASINVNGKHIATWMVGQVRNEIQNDEQLLKYADDIGADKAEFRLALAEVPKMSKPQFENICHSLFIFSNQLSKQAFQQLQLQRLNQLKGEELTQTRQELVHSETMASLGRLVAGFAHELNTPLGVAVGCASALQREAHKIRHLMAQEEVDVDDLLEAVISIEKGFTLTLSNLERAANLVTSFKRTAVDQTSGEVRTFRVLEVIEDTINTLQSRFKKTDIKIQVACPQELQVKSLPGALEQLLTNLLMNSLIHGFEEGQRAGQIQLVAQLQENHLHLDYSDSGKGIASENLAKIFEPFFTTHRAHGGSGLGMYICYNLVTTQLQGTITCDSVLGNGVKFTIIFPVSVD